MRNTNRKINRIAIAGFKSVLLIAMMLSCIITMPMPSSAATLSWSTVNTPSVASGQLQPGIRLDFFLIAQDGLTMFAYDNNSHQLYRSIDAGLTWINDGIGNGLEDDIDNSGTEDVDDNIVAMAISPGFEDDDTIVAATNGKVFRSINGGRDFSEVGVEVGGLLAASSTISSVDISTWYKGGIAILVGDSDGAQGGGISLFTSLDLVWTDLKVGDWDGDGVVETPCDVLAVAFPPNHQESSVMLAVITINNGGTSKTQVTTKLAESAWGANLDNGTLFTKKAATAIVDFPDNYDWFNMNHFFVGTTGTDDDDLFSVTAYVSQADFDIFDLNVNGSKQETNVRSVAIKSGGYSVSTSFALVGQVGLEEIMWSNNLTGSRATWHSSGKSLPGSDNVTVAWSPTSKIAYAMNGGINSAMSVSTDDGSTWNQFALINISFAANISIFDIVAVDSSIIYLLMHDDADGSGATSTNDYSMLFLTTDGGRRWEQILSHRSVDAEGLKFLRLSPDFATDQTLIVAQNDRSIWKSTDAGTTFSKSYAPQNITAIGIVSSSTYYTGHIDALYRNNRADPASLDGDTAVSIEIAPDGTVFVGTDNGTVLVSIDYGKTFSSIGGAQGLGSNADVIITLDPVYASNKIIYAGSMDPYEGVRRWILNSSASWQKMDDDNHTLACVGLDVTDYGAFYAGSNTIGKGVRRSVSFDSKKVFTDFESVTDGLSDTARIEKLSVVPGSTRLYAIVGDVAIGSNGYPYRVMEFEDTMAIIPQLVSPEDEAEISGEVALSWQGVESPIIPTYRYQVSLDSAFTNKVVDDVVSGTFVTIRGLAGGTQYWWRIFVEAGQPLRSKESNVWSFNLRLPAPILSSPAPAERDIPLKPMFAWEPVAEADNYTLEFADNSEFENSLVQTGLTHTVWALEKDLEYSTSYVWRVRAVKGEGASEILGDWSESSFTTVAYQTPIISKFKINEPEPDLSTVELTVPQPQVTVPPAPPNKQITPLYIWVITGLVFLLFIVIIFFIIATSRIKLF